MAEFTGTDSLWQMSPEQMELLRQNVDLWQKMADSGKGGYGNGVVEALGEYADLAGNIEELKEGLFEQLTGMSFDSMYDSFIDTLMDMDASAEDLRIICPNTLCVPCFQTKLVTCTARSLKLVEQIR